MRRAPVRADVRLDLASATRVVPLVQLPQPLTRDVGVDRRRRDVRVAQQHLHRAQVGAVVQQVRRKGVSQRVGRQRRMDAGRLRVFWESLGCRVLAMSPVEHDRKVARISHLPHWLAVVTTLAALRGDPEAVACAAGGFRDTTRVAGGDPDLWTGISLANREALLASLREASSVLTELVEILAKPDEEALRRCLTEAKNLRDLLPAAHS